MFVKKIMLNQLLLMAKTNAVKTQKMNTIQFRPPDIKVDDVDFLLQIGIYPPVNRLVCIGDLHGDLKQITIKVLKLAQRGSENHEFTDINKIRID